jgi:hypothetical protein
LSGLLDRATSARSATTEQEPFVDVRIGVIHTMKEIDVELPHDADPADIRTLVDDALSDGARVLWLTDRHGRQIGVPAERIAYIELGTPESERRIGFGS